MRRTKRVPVESACTTRPTHSASANRSPGRRDHLITAVVSTHRRAIKTVCGVLFTSAAHHHDGTERTRRLSYPVRVTYARFGFFFIYSFLFSFRQDFSLSSQSADNVLVVFLLSTQHGFIVGFFPTVVDNNYCSYLSHSLCHSLSLSPSLSRQHTWGPPSNDNDDDYASVVLLSTALRLLYKTPIDGQPLWPSALQLHVCELSTGTRPRDGRLNDRHTDVRKRRTYGRRIYGQKYERAVTLTRSAGDDSVLSADHGARAAANDNNLVGVVVRGMEPRIQPGNEVANREARPRRIILRIRRNRAPVIRWAQGAGRTQLVSVPATPIIIILQLLFKQYY